jgi:16S rRNA (adenine1518-N6/adenine1519-N6)-dimethyltransferase
MIGNIKKTQAILDKYQLKAKKGFGQNFLIDENILKKIVNEAGPDKETGVIEIGPGIGALTELLLESFRKVLAYEIDRNLIAVLQEELKAFNNFKVINQDFLKTDLKQDMNYFDDCKRVIVVSNLPYYITTPIILKFLEEENPIEEFYFMIQKEVGERLVAKKGTKDYGSLSVLMDYRTDARILFQVSRNSFLPRPQVDSVIIRLNKKKLNFGINNEFAFLKFIRNIFSQKRKTLANNLVRAYRLSKERIQEYIKEIDLNENIRSENLSLEQIATLYKNIFEAPN